MTENERSSDDVLKLGAALVRQYVALAAHIHAGARKEIIDQRAATFCELSRQLADAVNADEAARKQ